MSQPVEGSIIKKQSSDIELSQPTSGDAARAKFVPGDGLPFQRAIFKEAFEHDALNVVSKGIGLSFVLMKLLRVYSGGQLPVLVLGMNDLAAELK